LIAENWRTVSGFARSYSNGGKPNFYRTFVSLSLCYGAYSGCGFRIAAFLFWERKLPSLL